MYLAVAIRSFEPKNLSYVEINLDVSVIVIMYLRESLGGEGMGFGDDVFDLLVLSGGGD